MKTKWIWRYLATLALSFFFAPISLFAASLASDKASDPAYSGGWTNGSNGGVGWSTNGWLLFVAGSQSNAPTTHFISSSTTNNSSGDTNADGDIDTAGVAWGMLGNGEEVDAARYLNGALVNGQKFVIEMDNGATVSGGGEIGFLLQSTDAETRLEFLLKTNSVTYQMEGIDTGITNTDEGLRIVFEQVNSDTGHVFITKLVDGSTFVFSNVALNASVATHDVAVFSLINRSAGGAATNKLFFNSISILPNPADTTLFADLSVAKSASLNPAIVGSNLTYTITITNDGPAEATAVTVTDAAPSGVTFVSATPSQGTCVTNDFDQLVCDLGLLASNATASITLVITPLATGTLTNIVSVSSLNVDPNTANDSATNIINVVTAAQLSVTPTNLPFSTIATGDLAQADFVVTNLGGTTLIGTATVSSVAFAISSGSPFSVAAFGSTNVTVDFTPLSEGSFSNDVIFASNGGASTNPVTGTGAIIPTASFTGTPTNGLVPLDVTFSDTSTGTITNRFWDFGDSITTNTTTTNVVHQYTATGTRTIMLIVSGPVGVSTSTIPNYITVTNIPPELAVAPASHDFGTLAVGQVSTQNFSVINNGIDPLSGTATVSGASFALLSGSPFNNVSGGQTSTVAVTFTPGSEGAFTGSVEFASNGGVSTNAVTGTGAIEPTASFTGTPTNGVAPLDVTFSDTSTGTITNRFWDFGDSGTTNTTATNVVHQYTSGGTNTVTLIVTGPLGVSTNIQPAYIIVTNIPPQLAVTPASRDFGTLAVGQSNTQNFSVINNGVDPLSGTATVTGDVEFAVLSGSPFNVSGGQTSTVAVTFTPGSAGSFTGSVVFTSNGGVSTNAVTGTGAIVPTASFTGTPTNGLVPLDVTFSDTSTGTITNRFWDFGDSITTNTTATNVVHQYTSGGTNNVTLIVTGPLGVSTNTQTGYITVTNIPPLLVVTPANHDFGLLPVGDVSTQDFSVVNEGLDALSGTAVVSGSGFALLSGSPYSVSGGQTGVVAVTFTPGSAASFTGSVVFASNGGVSTNAVTGTGAVAVTANFTASQTNGATPLVVSFTDASSGTITGRVWRFGDTGTSTATSPSHTYTNAGTFSASLTVFGPLGSNTLARLITATNASAPTVSILRPANGMVYPPLTNLAITIVATASDADGISKIEFFDGTNKLGEVSSSLATNVLNAPTNGIHTLTARAIDTLGQTNTSAAVTITVGGKNSPLGDWELKIRGADKGNGFLTFTDDASVTGYEIRSKIFGLDELAGQWNFDPKGKVTGPFIETLGSGTNWTGTLLGKAKSLKSLSGSVTATNGTYKWKGALATTFPDLSGTWSGQVTVAKIPTVVVYAITTNVTNSGVFDVATAAATNAVIGQFIATSKNAIAGYITINSNQTTLSGKFKASKSSISLKGDDEDGSKVKLKIIRQ